MASRYKKVPGLPFLLQILFLFGRILHLTDGSQPHSSRVKRGNTACRAGGLHPAEITLGRQSRMTGGSSTR
jgi:hypothetical protein